MDGLFDTILGLPLHPLVVHGAVVLLPLAALSLVVAALWPWWRSRALAASVVALTVALAAAVLAKESGEALAGRVGLPVEHAAWADRLVPVAAVTWLAAAAWLLLSRRRGAARVHEEERVTQGRTPGAATDGLGATAAAPAGETTRRPHGLVRALAPLTAVLSLATIVMTALVGHTGATATWADQMGAGSTVTPTGVAPSTTTTRVFDLAQVAQHKDASSCWTAIDGKVYDLTSWVSQHPGGKNEILSLCGKDGSTAFTEQHGGQATPTRTLARFAVGTLSDHDGDEG